MKTLMSWIITIGFFLCGIITVLAISAPAKASGRHDGDSQTAVQYIYVGKDDNHAKYVIGGAILTCAVISLYRQRWCWEDKKPAPLPDPGPAVPNDVTPDPVGVRIYQ